MNFVEISFVLIMLLAGLWAVLVVRRDFLDKELSQRDVRRQADIEERRRRALSRSYRSSSRNR